MRSEIKKKKRLLNRIVIVVIVCILCFGSGFLISLKQPKSSKITSNTLFQQVQTISNIATLEYNYTNMGKFTNSADFKGWTIPFTEKSFIIAYDGRITAGVDMKEIQIHVSGKTIKIAIPAAQILSHEVNENSIELYDETKNIFNPISVKDYADFSAKQKKVMEKKVIEGGLLRSAQQRAQKVIKELFSSNSKIEEEYKLQFKMEKGK